jgi:WhiB family redox-sensing transcriptional regulator
MSVNRLPVLALVDLVDELADGAHCRFDPELHTGPDAFTDEPAAQRRAREDAAHQVCEDCPVWGACLELALRTRPRHGIWAGMTAREISALATSARQVAEAAS